ncbi:MAG TPA: type VI secretion system baseplate subunit TssF [Nevskia sp.]|nr:type VI secretion system baseplate subunit TssF [Nevskia sp.]
MHELLPYYEKELTFLRRHAREFAEAYPKVAARLLLSGEACEDPHVERLLQSFALLTARVSKKLDDDFPEITESMLDVLYPHYLRPFPSCSIVRFDNGQADAQLSAPITLPRGTMLATRPVKGVSCRFRTAYDVTLSPLAVTAAALEDGVDAARGLRTVTDASQILSLSFETRSAQLTLDQLGLAHVRLFLDGDSSLVSQIREALFQRCCGAAVRLVDQARWQSIDDEVVLPVGFAPDEGLLDYDARSDLAYRLLSEYFAFPEKFNFIDIRLDRLLPLLPAGCRRFELKLLLRAATRGNDESRLLERVSASNFVLGCTPVVNLFRQPAEPIRMTRTKTRYSVVPDARRAHAYEVYRINSVRKVEKSTHGESVIEYRPFYSLNHAEAFAEHGRFWHLKRNDEVAALSPGYEYELSIVDFDFRPLDDKTETLSIELTCTNRDLPSQLPYGLAGGDLFVDGGSPAREIKLLRRPTATCRVDRGGGAQWRLISHLSLNHLSLSAAGTDALKETLTLYDLPRSPANRRQIAGIQSIGQRPSTAMLPGNPFPVFVRGLEVSLTLDEASYVGTGSHLFASVLDHFFAQYVHANSFVRLVVRAHKDGEEILRCPARNGSQRLA